MIATLPRNLRDHRMQPRIVLVDSNSDLSAHHDRQKLELILNALVQDVWTNDTGDLVREKASRIRGGDDLFFNFVLVQSGGWFSWNRLRVYFWDTQNITTARSGLFQRTPYLVSRDALLDFVLEPPEREAGKGWKYVANLMKGAFRVDVPGLLAFVVAQAALTVYATYKLAWA